MVLLHIAMIIFTGEQIRKMGEHASDVYPQECCGILLGTREKERRIVAEICRVHNASEQPREHFVIRSDSILDAERMASKKGLEIVGFYHSHPNHSAFLSDEDCDYVMPEMSYPVISVAEKNVTGLKSWEQKCIAEKIAIVQETMLIKEGDSNGSNSTDFGNPEVFYEPSGKLYIGGQDSQ
jgi:proteasome lid subunit RPN8/RPN11